MKRFLALVLFVATFVVDTPLSAQPIDARVTMYHGRPTIFLNGKPIAPMIYALTDVPGGRMSWEEVPQHNIRNFCNQGFRLFQLDLALEQIWKEDGTFDISLARRQVAGVTAVCPDAAVIFRFHVTAPKWWMLRHPEEWVSYADVDKYYDEDPNGFPRIIEDDNFPVRRISMASDVWKQEAARRLEQFLRELASSQEGNSVAGIQVADGIYGEWHNWGFFRNEPDVSEPMTREYRLWLIKKYGNDRALQRAWGQKNVSLASASAPGMAERETAAGVFRDPSREQAVIDFYECMHECVADNILFYAGIVKKTWPRPVIVGTFYGYYFSTFSRQAAGGHLDLQRVLASPDIDYLSGPQAYEPEALKLGEPYRSRSLVESVRLHGKLWLDEMDNEPTIPIVRDRLHDVLLRNAVANARRNVLFSATKGMGLWFYDFGVGSVDLDGWRYNHRGSRGNWDHPSVMADIGAMRDLVQKRLNSEYRSEADVLLVYDAKSFFTTGSLRRSDPVSNTLVDYVSLAAYRSGVIFDPIHIDDLPRVDLSRYKTVVFGNVFVLDKKQKEYIHTNVASGGRHLIWFYAPGYSDGARLSAEFIDDVTGIRLSPITLNSIPEILIPGLADSTIRYRGADSLLTPLFAVTDQKAEVLGTYAGTSHASVAKKAGRDFTSWYIALPSKQPEPLRSILRQTGAHVYTTNGEIVYGGSGMLVVHTAKSGTHSVKLRNGTVRSFDLPEGASTLVLDPHSGNELLPLH